MMTINEESTSSASSAPDSAPASKPKKRGAASRKPSKAKARGKVKATRKAARKGKPEKTFALVCRLGIPTYRKAWRTVQRLQKRHKPGQPRVSMSSWLTGLIDRAAK